MNRELTPPKEQIKYHHSFTENQTECYARLKVQEVIEWQISELLSEYQTPVSNKILDYLNYSILSAWQNVNFINHDPRKELIVPQYSRDMIPVLLDNLRHYGLSQERHLVSFLLKRSSFMDVA